MKKKILLILTEFPPAIGGMQTHAILLSRHLARLGMEVIVYTYRPNEQALACAQADEGFDFPVHRTLSRISYFYTLDVLVKAVKTHGVELIYSSTVFYGILQKMTGVPVICRSVGNDILRPWIVYPFKTASTAVSNHFVENRLYHLFKRMHRPELVEQLFREQRMALTIASAKSASVILANSEYTRKKLVGCGIAEENISLMVGGVDALFFKPRPTMDKFAIRKRLGLPETKKVLLTACRLVDKKGVDFLIRSMAALRHRRGDQRHGDPGAHLVIVGDGRRYEAFKNLAEALGMGESISFTGALPYDQMPPYYWAADVFVLASTEYKDPGTGLYDAETMGRVLLEANAAGTPVIATDSGGIPSVIEHGVNGLLFPENDEAAFFRRLDALSDPGLKTRLIDQGLEMAARRFDWKHMLKIHLDAFKVAAQGRAIDRLNQKTA